MFLVSEKIKATKVNLLKWNKSKFGNMRVQLKDLRDKLKAVKDRPQAPGAVEEERAIMGCIDEVLAREEAFWKQRSRVAWLTEGDRNTGYFHARASERRRKNLIRGLRDSTGQWQTEDEKVEEIIVDYFQHLFTSSHPHNTEQILKTMDRRVSDRMNANLMREFCAEEVKAALFQMHPTKAPGLDGMPALFF